MLIDSSVLIVAASSEPGSGLSFVVLIMLLFGLGMLAAVAGGVYFLIIKPKAGGVMGGVNSGVMPGAGQGASAVVPVEESGAIGEGAFVAVWTRGRYPAMTVVRETSQLNSELADVVVMKASGYTHLDKIALGILEGHADTVRVESLGDGLEASLDDNQKCLIAIVSDLADELAWARGSFALDEKRRFKGIAANSSSDVVFLVSSLAAVKDAQIRFD